MTQRVTAETTLRRSATLDRESRKAVFVTLAFQTLILLALAYGEFRPSSAGLAVLGGLAACYCVLDIVVVLLAFKSSIFSLAIVRIGLYILNFLITIGYGMGLDVLRKQ